MATHLSDARKQFLHDVFTTAIEGGMLMGWASVQSYRWAKPRERVMCAMFALCDRPATKMVKHPVLTEVASCDRCHDKLGGEVARTIPEA